MTISGNNAVSTSGGFSERCRVFIEVEDRWNDNHREMNDAEVLMDIIQRNYNMFLTQSAAVGELVNKMEEIKKKFLALRRKEIESRRKNMTREFRKSRSFVVMAGMKDVMANVLDDPFKEVQETKSNVCYKQ